MIKLTKRFTQMQMIIYGYLLLILLGAFLLMLPAASKDGQMTNFIDAAFTATSATCVTGLVVFDTFQKWTVLGQIIIMVLIQLGGLGFMTFGVGFSIILKRKIGVWTRGALQETVNINQIGGVVRLTKKVILGTVLFEGIGAVILSVRFCRDFPVVRGIYYGIFHSISAFCNAGFDLMGCIEPYSSLTTYAGDWIVNLTIMALIVIGGLGFLVWADIQNHRLHFGRYSLHSKLVIVVTTSLIVLGAMALLLLERNATLEGMPWNEKILASLFGSITPRTAGFNTVDTGALTEGSKLLTIMLMFIGGSPGSTAGGIKTTTFIVLVLFTIGIVSRREGSVFHRKIADAAVRKACAVLCVNLALCVIGIFLISAAQPELNGVSVMFEVTSALGTVGMSTGITRDLENVSKVVIILLMYFGRVGSLSFALSLFGKKRTSVVKYPTEVVNIG